MKPSYFLFSLSCYPSRLSLWLPITGGTFSGPNIKGIALPGGADFQLTRTDGDTEFEARHMFKTDAGVAIHVDNRASKNNEFFLVP